jgi:hypothetical protein
MVEQDYSSSITENITAQEAAERISRVTDWWSASFTGASDKVGDTFTLRWADTFVDFAVLEFVPSKKIIWRTTDCNLPFIEDKKEWKDTHVVFDISSNGSATTVTMTHAGLAPGVECYETCKKGWDFYILESLKNLLKENRGFPEMRRTRASAEKAAAES